MLAGYARACLRRLRPAGSQHYLEAHLVSRFRDLPGRIHQFHDLGVRQSIPEKPNCHATESFSSNAATDFVKLSMSVASSRMERQPAAVAVLARATANTATVSFSMR